MEVFTPGKTRWQVRSLDVLPHAVLKTARAHVSASLEGDSRLMATPEVGGPGVNVSEEAWWSLVLKSIVAGRDCGWETSAAAFHSPCKGRTGGTHGQWGPALGREPTYRAGVRRAALLCKISRFCLKMKRDKRWQGLLAVLLYGLVCGWFAGGAKRPRRS